ncbi:uncharacterized protein LOC144878990 isoform X1 [Branchiostoma floridae x Branchiostoma japonicum]
MSCMNPVLNCKTTTTSEVSSVSLCFFFPQWFMFVSFSFMSFVCGFAASMMAEAPILELEKILLPSRRGREAKPETAADGGHDNMAMKTVECDPDPPLPLHDGKGTSGPIGC